MHHLALIFHSMVVPRFLLFEKVGLLTSISIGESPSKYPFLKNNGSEAPKGPRIHYFSGMDTYEDFLRLKIHHTLASLYRYNKRF